MVDFAGWEMPVQYTGVSAEHLAVRRACGVFDVSHMGEIETTGPQALGLLQRLLSNDLAAIGFDEQSGQGGAQYSLLCRQDGGVLDDLITYRLGPDRFLTVTNAANHERDLLWFQEQAGASRRAQVEDLAAGFAMLAVQGPDARGIVAGARRRRPCRRGCEPPGARRRGGRRWCAAPATPARTASSCCARPQDAGDAVG